MRLAAQGIGGLLARDLCDGAARVSVLARFDAHLYLDAAGGVMLLARSEPGPLTITLGDWPVRALAAARGGMLRGGVLDLDSGLTLDLRAAVEWPSVPDWSALPPVAAIRTAAMAHAGRSDLLAAVLAVPVSGAAPLPGLSWLEAGLLPGGDPLALRQGAGALAGLGQGLTPAGDDFLCGVMLALHARAQDAAAPCAVILDSVRDATTTISAAFLRAAAQGHAAPDWHRLGAGGATEAAVAAICALGHSSGADALAGFVWTLQSMIAPPAPLRRRSADPLAQRAG